MGTIGRRAARLLAKFINRNSLTCFQKKVSIPKKFHCNHTAVKLSRSVPMLYTHTLSFTIRKSQTKKSLLLNYELSDSGTLCA